MAYGRLDVFWPDGQFKTFQLVENTISVGRSTGNSIALETTTISRYHFSLTHDGQTTYITDMDSANGSFVDGVRLPANTRALAAWPRNTPPTCSATADPRQMPEMRCQLRPR